MSRHFQLTTATALGASEVVRTKEGVLYAASIRIDASAASDDYYFQMADLAAVPANGAVTLLMTNQKLQHTSGTDTNFSYDFKGAGVENGPDGVAFKTGLTWWISTTDFTKTIVGSNVAVGTFLIG